LNGVLKVGVVGLGYVGLPLAASFSRHFDVTGFDIDERRIASLSRGVDDTFEMSAKDFADLNVKFTAKPCDLKKLNFFIVTVPTPVDQFSKPDLEPLKRASRLVGQNLAPGSVVVFESTVYPGVTEEICSPILEQYSGLKLNVGFFVGYSPERVNPGDSDRKLENIVKVTSGSTEQAASFIDEVYSKVITAGTKRAPSIRIAEAAKVIENVQRDVNIALVNEYAILFNKLGLSVTDILDVASTKWNFLPFKPGLVGGHCIGVDPYYLTHKCQEIGYHPELILAGRRINDSMAEWYASFIAQKLRARAMFPPDLNGLVLGLTFKENCPDLRNSKSPSLCAELRNLGFNIDAYDPYVSAADEHELPSEVELVSSLVGKDYDFVVLVVPHQLLIADVEVSRILRSANSIFDLKAHLDKQYKAETL